METKQSLEIEELKITIDLLRQQNDRLKDENKKLEKCIKVITKAVGEFKLW